MSLFVMLWQRLKSVASPRVLNFARFIYSPGYRMGQRAERTRKLVAPIWPDLEREMRGRVVGGPFRGLQYINEAAGSALAPKLLGTYEMELHPIIEAIVARQPTCIIDIGAAEGYYAVGMAMRLPACRVIAFESELYGQELLRQLATANGVADRIEIHGHCTPETLQKCMAANASDLVIVCDVEGAELSLLDPSQTPKLAHCSILVELHPVVEKKIKSIFFSRFRSSSKIKTLSSRTRVIQDFPASIPYSVNDAQKLACMDEVRPQRMDWLWMEPKNR